MTQPQQIVVDLDQLRDTWQTLKSDTWDGLSPGLAMTGSKIQQWVPFGVKARSGEVEAAYQAFVHALSRHEDNFVSHVRRADQVIRALDQILTNYQDADDLTKVKADAIQRAIAEALPPLPPHATHGRFA